MIIFKGGLQDLDPLDKILLIFMIVGLSIAVISLFRGITKSHQVQIEYLKEEERIENEGSELIFVDVEGAVINPGVYSFQKTTRLKDVLIAAGGYSEEADRDYCEKSLNLAQVVKDGQKIYIPKIGDTPAYEGYSEANSTKIMVNVNNASLEELDTLWGVGPAKAEAIVKNRPYKNIEELVEKKVISKQMLDKNREVVSIY